MIEILIPTIFGTVLANMIGKKSISQENQQKLQNSVTKAINRTYELFVEKYSPIDEEIVEILTKQTQFFDMEKVQDAMKSVSQKPLSLSSQPYTDLKNAFLEVLPEQEAERGEKAFNFFIEIFHREISDIDGLEDKQLLHALRKAAKDLADIVGMMREYKRSAELSLEPAKPKTDLNQPRTPETQYIVDLIQKIVSYEDAIGRQQETIRRYGFDTEIEKNIQRYSVESNNCIDELEEKITPLVDIDTVLIEFEKSFTVQWQDSKSIKFVQRLEDVAKKILSLASGIETPSYLNLLLKVGTLHKIMNRVVSAKRFLLKEAFPLAKSLEETKAIDAIEAAEYYYTIYDYGSCLDLNMYLQAQYLAEEYPLKEKRRELATERSTCLACLHLRRGMVDEAKVYIEKAKEKLEIYEKETRTEQDKQGYRERLSFFYLVQGVYLFQKGTLYFEEARKMLLNYLDAIDKYEQRSYFYAYALYLISKIYIERDDVRQAKMYRESSKEMFSKDIIRNVCMFNYEDVIKDIEEMDSSWEDGHGNQQHTTRYDN